MKKKRLSLNRLLLEKMWFPAVVCWRTFVVHGLKSSGTSGCMRNTPVWKNQNHKHWQVICFVSNQVAFISIVLLTVSLLMCPSFDTRGIISDWKVQQAPYLSEFMHRYVSGRWFVVAPGYDDKLCPWLSLWLGNSRPRQGSMRTYSKLKWFSNKKFKNTHI